LFEGWEGHELALYADFGGGRGTSLEIAERINREKAAARLWVLDLGNRAVSLPDSQGGAFQRKLEQNGIPYSTGPLDDVYFRRIERVTRDHEELLRELANR